VTRERRALVKRYCFPRRTLERDWTRDAEAYVAELHRQYLSEHPGHDFTIGTTAQRSPVH
jgi:hypothetical protein